MGRETRGGTIRWMLSMGVALTWLGGCERPRQSQEITAGTAGERSELSAPILVGEPSLTESGTGPRATLQEDVTAGTWPAGGMGPQLTERAGNPAKEALGTRNFTLARTPVPGGGLPPSSGPYNTSGTVSMAMDARGWPVVASIEFDGHDFSLPVRAWNGSGWTSLGTGPSNQGSFGWPFQVVVAVDGQGSPVVAWTDQGPDNGTDVFVSRWDGTRWRLLGESFRGYPGSTHAFSPTLTLDDRGNPVIAWSEWHDAKEELSDVFVRRWSGTAWEPLGSALSALEGNPENDQSAAFDASITLDPAGHPVVAWAEFDPIWGRSYIFVRTWDGAAWQPLGEPLSKDASAGPDSPSIAISSEGTVYVAWAEFGYGHPDSVYVSKWDGSRWEALADPPAMGGGEQLMLDSRGVPMMAWSTWDSTNQPNGGYIVRWTGSRWDHLPLPTMAIQPLAGPAHEGPQRR